MISHLTSNSQLLIHVHGPGEGTQNRHTTNSSRSLPLSASIKTAAGKVFLAAAAYKKEAVHLHSVWEGGWAGWRVEWWTRRNPERAVRWWSCQFSLPGWPASQSRKRKAELPSLVSFQSISALSKSPPQLTQALRYKIILTRASAHPSMLSINRTFTRKACIVTVLRWFDYGGIWKTAVNQREE